MRQEFNQLFSQENKSAILTKLMQQAIAEKKRQQRSRLAVNPGITCNPNGRDSEAKEDAGKALDLLKKVGVGEVELIQPPHWLPEVIAVITPIRPIIAEQAIGYLTAMDIRTEHETDVLKITAQLSRQLNHHLFNTYYHALTIFHDGFL